MGAWLARLKNQKSPDTHATKPTKPPQGEDKAGFVGFVAYPAAPFANFRADEGAGFVGFVAYPPAPFAKIRRGDGAAIKPQATAANEAARPDPAPATDPDRYCWPHSEAMNTAEIDAFMARLARFTDKGMSYDEAERLADALVARDRQGDDRRLCLECAHLQGAGRWRCGNWRQADVARDALARDLVLMLQRCAGFAASAQLPLSEGRQP